MSAAKVGRPPSENPRQIHLHIKLTQDESNVLKECAKSLNATQTEVVVMGIQKMYKSIKAKKGIKK